MVHIEDRTHKGRFDLCSHESNPNSVGKSVILQDLFMPRKSLLLYTYCILYQNHMSFTKKGKLTSNNCVWEEVFPRYDKFLATGICPVYSEL